jgi:hypothetical protein
LIYKKDPLAIQKRRHLLYRNSNLAFAIQNVPRHLLYKKHALTIQKIFTCYTETTIWHLLYKMCQDICYTKKEALAIQIICTCYTEIAFWHLLYKICQDICYTKMEALAIQKGCTCYTEIAILHLLYKMCNDICYTKRMHLLYKKHALAIQKQQSGICYTNCEITSAVKTFYSHMHYEFAIRWQSKEAGRAEGAEGQGGSELGSAEKKKNK